MSYVSRQINTRQCCCIFVSAFRCHCTSTHYLCYNKRRVNWTAPLFCLYPLPFSRGGGEGGGTERPWSTRAKQHPANNILYTNDASTQEEVVFVDVELSSGFEYLGAHVEWEEQLVLLEKTTTRVPTHKHGWQRGSVIRTSVFGCRNFPYLRMIYGWHVTTPLCGLSVLYAMGRPTRPTQPSIPSE